VAVSFVCWELLLIVDQKWGTQVGVRSDWEGGVFEASGVEVGDRVEVCLTPFLSFFAQLLCVEHMGGLCRAGLAIRFGAVGGQSCGGPIDG